MKTRSARMPLLLWAVICAYGSARAAEPPSGREAVPAQRETPDQQAAPDDIASTVPEGKQTTLGLYVTAKEAYEKWQANPEHVKIIDVRTPEEFVYVGHAPMAWNVPWQLTQHKIDAEKKSLVMIANSEFVKQVQQLAQPGDTLLLTCRSGGRSAAAVNALAAAGFQNAFSIIDGMEGDPVKDPQSPDFGKRTLNGWRNGALPWTCDLDPQRVLLPESPKQQSQEPTAKRGRKPKRAAAGEKKN